MGCKQRLRRFVGALDGVANEHACCRGTRKSSGKLVSGECKKRPVSRRDPKLNPWVTRLGGSSVNLDPGMGLI